MKALARKVVLLIALAALGCAQIPICTDAPPKDLWLDSKAVSRAIAPVPPVSAEVARGAEPQEQPGKKALPTIPPPRPVGDTKLPPTITPPTTDDGQTLDQLEDLADKVNPTLRRDQFAIESARGKAVQAGLFPNPRFDTNNPQVINGRQSLLNAGFQIEIPVAAKKRLDQSAANESIRQAEITYAQNRATLHATIRQQFYQILVDQERVAVLTTLTDLAKKSYEAAVKLREFAKEATDVDVKLLLVAAQQAEASLKSTQAILDGDRRQLEAIIGSPGILTGPLKGQVKGPYPNYDANELIAYVTKNHTQINLALSILRQNRTLLRRAEVEVYPNPYLGPAYQFGLVPGNDQFWFNIQIAIPTFDRNQGNIRAARADISQAAENIDVARLNLVNQAEGILSNYRAARALVERYEGDNGALKTANDAAALVRLQYAGRFATLAVLLQAQQQAAQVNSAYIDALQTLWLNATQLSGLLQEEKFLKGPEPKAAIDPKMQP